MSIGYTKNEKLIKWFLIVTLILMIIHLVVSGLGFFDMHRKTHAILALEQKINANPAYLENLINERPRVAVKVLSKLAHYKSLFAVRVPGFVSGGEQNAKLLAAAYFYQEKAYKISTNAEDKFDSLISLVDYGFGAGRFEKLEDYANELIKQEGLKPSDWNYNYAAHVGYITLGSLALKNKDVNSAKSNLLKACKFKTSDVISIFGPKVSLAGELLKAGEKEAVLEFIDDCAQLWTDDFLGESKRWKRDIEAGTFKGFDPISELLEQFNSSWKGKKNV